MRKCWVVFCGLFVSLVAPLTYAKGNLARKCVALPELVFGTDEAGFAVSQSDYRLETGVCYSLKNWKIRAVKQSSFLSNSCITFFANRW